MTYICNPSAPVNGDATPSRQKFRLQDKLHGDRRLTDAERCVGYFIIDWYGIGGRNYTFTRHDRLAEYTGLDVRTVRRSIAKLVALGYITIRTRGRWGRASEYVPIFLPVYEDIPMSSCSPHMRTGQSAHEDIAMSEHEDKAMSTHTLPTRSANEGLVVSPADAGVAPGGAPPRGAGADAGASDGAALFEAFWAIYPRKEGRAIARKAFDAAMARGVSVETLIDGARRYAAAKAHADPNWLKFPATWLRDECWLEDPQPPRRKEPEPERAPKANGNAASDRAPRASKANGKAEPPAGSLDETEPFEIFEDDDGWSDDPERIQPEAIEMGFSRDRCVRLKSNGRKGQVLGAVMGDDPRVVDKCLWVTVCWKSTPMSMVSELDLELENPTPEERVATAAAAEKRAKRLAEQVRRRDEVPKRFPIGARVQRRSDGRTGKVIKIDLDALLLDVMWDDIRDRDCHLIRKSSGSQISWMSDDEIERVSS